MEKNESRKKMNNYQLGELFLKIVEIKRRIESGALNYKDTIDALQNVIENNGHIMAKVIKGVAEIRDLPHTVDLDEQPLEINGYMVVSHNGGGVFNFDDRAVTLFSEDIPKNGYQLKSLITNAFNGNMLDFLLNHQDLIPNDCREVYTCFLGTIYQDLQDDQPYIRAMYNYRDCYHSVLLPLDNDFDRCTPILLPA